MKKKYCYCLFVLLSFPLLALDFNFYSSDEYFGSAGAECIGTTEGTDLKSVFLEVKKSIKNTRVGNDYQKMSKRVNFLTMSALCEYDYKVGEIYIVCIPDEYNESGLVLVVEITGYLKFNWYGFYTFS